MGQTIVEEPSRLLGTSHPKRAYPPIVFGVVISSGPRRGAEGREQCTKKLQCVGSEILAFSKELSVYRMCQSRQETPDDAYPRLPLKRVISRYDVDRVGGRLPVQHSQVR
jgi:hypothetical protein